MDLGSYQPRGEIGCGGMGVVWRAVAPDGSDVAVKILRVATPEALARFDRERRLQESLDEEEGFVPLVGQGSSSAGPFVVMPFLAGGTLKERLRRGALPLEDALALGRALARAVAIAHARGIVHRDLKPANVLFRGTGLERPLIADLGLAKHFRRDLPGASASDSISQDGDVYGTPGYMAPEQAGQVREAGPPADVFALGAILYEALAGRPAFAGETRLQILVNAAQGTFEPLAAVRPDVPPWLASAIERALDPEPSLRFQDAAVFLSALGGRVRSPRRAWLVIAAFLSSLGALAAITSRRAWSAGDARPPSPSSTSPTTSRAGSGATALALLERARARRVRRDWDGTIRECERALAIDPGLARAWSLRAEARAAKGDAPDVAIRDADRAIELDRKDARAWAARGLARGTKGDFTGAAADTTRAIELDPNDAETWLARGAARDRGGDWDGALSDFSRALDLDETLAIAWRNRGLVRTSKGDDEGATIDLGRAIELDPMDAVAYGTRGMLRGRRGDHDGALADLSRSIELDPRSPRTLTDRSVERFATRDLDGAIEDAGRAIELDPRIPEAWLNRGVARGAKGDPSSAATDLARAVELDPSLAPAWLGLGSARNATGDRAGAVAAFERFLELAPSHPRAADVRLALADLRGR